jgi:hypothetical protein
MFLARLICQERLGQSPWAHCNREDVTLCAGSGPSGQNVEAEYVGGVVILRTKEDVARDRLPGVFLAAAVVFVLVTWAATLVYFGVRFL